jgi:hypothetical protein
MTEGFRGMNVFCGEGYLLNGKEWITSVIENAGAEGITLFIKDNAGYSEKVQEYPNLLKSGIIRSS